jgi:tetratricopeptide (TPR) repeat protein
VNRSLTWINKREYDQAIADCDRALELEPGYVLAHQNRGLAWYGKREYAKALEDYSKALRLYSGLASAYRHLAWLRATCPDQELRDGALAFGNASRAYQLSGGKEWSYSDTLAAAYAESGDFKQAVAWETKAIELAKDAASKQACRARLELYKSRKPYRDEPKSP